MSLHKSGKLLLAIYQNRVLRLWNLMNARCTFKRKVCLSDDKEYDAEKKKVRESDDEDHLLDEEAGEDEQVEMKVELSKKDLSEHDREPVEIKWEPSESKIYAILYRRMIEVFNVEDESGGEHPCSYSIFDSVASSFDFIGPK